MIQTSFNRRQIISLLFLAVIGGAAANILPFIFASFSLVFDIESTATLTTAELFGICVSGLTFSYWRNRLSLKLSCLLGLLLFISGNGITMAADGDFNITLFARLLCGLGAGIVTSHAFSIIGNHKNPEPLFALVLVAQVIWSAGASFVMPALSESVPLLSFSFLLVCGLIAIIPMALWMPMPEKQNEDLEDYQQTPLLKRLKWIVIATTIIWYAALGLFWADSANRGMDMGLSATFISSIFAAGYLASLTGNGIAIYLANRFDRSYPMLISGGVHLMVYFMFYLSTSGDDKWIYAVAVLIYSVSWAIFTPFQLGLYSEFSVDGRFAAMFLPATVVGMTFGTQFNGLLGEDGKMILATFFMAICLGCYAYVFKRLPQFYGELEEQYGSDALNDENYSQV
ncbi:MFS transporter [Pseudoteredinibacter isoporae]|uniref:MFS family permease n=1 Tax=Pseudoteredinibacter isoporae TaxID=570281 RepID=A0A7X0JSR7_9GAMM|nr:MFS transporter [Pseudoteredinibacter isoporae]MBB6520735.1 MFS family permease [Pseudoteredinibacter isoporae]NHO86302.1 MFS transporter [Pseudoteredinibacter isoporae]NIB25247.1 MFS transporter [Pseudoteredinibacter isoporae]